MRALFLTICLLIPLPAVATECHDDAIASLIDDNTSPQSINGAQCDKTTLGMINPNGLVCKTDKDCMLLVQTLAAPVGPDTQETPPESSTLDNTAHTGQPVQ